MADLQVGGCSLAWPARLPARLSACPPASLPTWPARLACLPALPARRNGLRIMVSSQWRGANIWGFFKTFSLQVGAGAPPGWEQEAWARADLLPPACSSLSTTHGPAPAQVWLATIFTAVAVGIVVWCIEKAATVGRAAQTAGDDLPSVGNSMVTAVGKLIGVRAAACPPPCFQPLQAAATQGTEGVGQPMQRRPRLHPPPLIASRCSRPLRAPQAFDIEARTFASHLIIIVLSCYLSLS